MTKNKTGNQSENSKILVTTSRGGIPFSVGYLADALLGIGISYEQAYQDAQSISTMLLDKSKRKLTSKEIMQYTCDYYAKFDQKLARRVEILQNRLEPIKPIVVLLGGVTGIGKSTLTQIVATRFNIKSVIGTDLIREVLRITLSSNLMPSLHTSSYIAYQQLDTSFMPAREDIIVGFEEQARTVSVGIEAAIEQAIDDDEILIIEGVHLVPGLIKKEYRENPHVISIQLILKDEATHKSRLKRRETKTHSRGTAYSMYFDNIRIIQDYLIEQAKQQNVPIIEVDDDERAIIEILDLIWEQQESHNSEHN